MCTYKERKRVRRLIEEGIAPLSVLLDRSLQKKKKKNTQTIRNSLELIKHEKNQKG